MIRMNRKTISSLKFSGHLSFRSMLLLCCLIPFVFASLTEKTMAIPELDKIKMQRQEKVKQFIEFINSGKTNKAFLLMDKTMQTGLPEAKLKELWQALQQQFGAFKSIGEIKSEQLPAGFEREIILANFEKAQKDLIVALDSSGLVAGFFVKDHFSGFTLAPYVHKESFDDKDLKVGTGEFQLDATLSIPKGNGPFTAVVLVHGSGPHDRDETVGGVKPFRDLSWGLASNGIAVLRYEKRNFRHAKEMLAEINNLTVKEETIDDALAAVKVLQSHPQIDAKHIYVLGHSLGGMLIPRIAKSDDTICGVVVLAGTTRPLEDVMVEQFEYLFSLNRATAEQVKDAKELARAVKDPNLAASKKKVLGAAPAYWLDLRNYDPPKMAASVSIPMLVLQAESDYQVTMKDYQRWKDALSSRDNVIFKTYPGLGHLFTKASSPSTPDDYQKPSNVDPQVVQDIASWIKTRS